MSIEWWQNFWAENNRCLYGNALAGNPCTDNLPITPTFTTKRSRAPVLIELGEDWIIGRMGVSYRRFIQDFEFQQQTRTACAEKLMTDIGFYLKPKVDSSSLLHGSIYGNSIEYPENSTPWLKHLVRDKEDITALIARMEHIDLSQAGLVPWFVANYKRLDRPYRWRILHDATSVHGPGTILSFLFGISGFALYLYDEPDLMHTLLDVIGNATVEYSRTVRCLTGAPVTGVGIFDDVAGLASPKHFRQFFLPVYEKIYGELAPQRADDRFYHNDARVSHLLDFLGDLGVNGINPDPETDPALLRQKLPEAIIYGCVPPLILQSGTPEAVMTEARRSIARAGEGGGLVLTTAGSIPIGTPYENLHALCQAAEQFGAMKGDR
jgi:uroporphyrinogen decarboxylase